MLVVDFERSEHGRQRRKSTTGRLLHCCCVCGVLEIWGAHWSYYASIKLMDDCALYPKFCSEKCRMHVKSITKQMMQKATDAEWREPNVVWREATNREKYAEAAYEQQRRKCKLGEQLCEPLSPQSS